MEHLIIKLLTKRILLNFPLKLPELKSDFTLTLGYLNPALNNPAQISPISTCKIQPNSNFCFSEVQGFDAHFWLSKLIIKKYFLVFITIVITIVISIYIFWVYLFIHQFFFTECLATCFKNSSYIFSKSGRDWSNNRIVCIVQGGNLVSIETEEKWQFINYEIRKRGTWNTSTWHIGLRKIDGVWTWESGEQLNVSKWQYLEPDSHDSYAEISENGGVFNGISKCDDKAYICEMPGGKITFQP